MRSVVAMRPLHITSCCLVAALLAACAAPPSAETSTNEEGLTQARVSKLSNASNEAVRAAFDAAVDADKQGFYGYAAAFNWGTDVPLSDELTDEQLSFLASELIQDIQDTEDRVPYGLSFSAVDVDPVGLAAGTLRLVGPSAESVEAALVKATGAGLRVARYEPTVLAPDARPTAGAVLLVDMKAKQALILYGRRGQAPAHVECKVTKMISYEFEESLSKEEYPHVDAQEVALTGDVQLSVGAIGPFSNSTAMKDGTDYHVIATRVGSRFEVEAKSARNGLLAKLVVDGNTGLVYGDRDGNGRPNQAATVACEGRTSVGSN